MQQERPNGSPRASRMFDAGREAVLRAMQGQPPMKAVRSGRWRWR